MTFDNHEDDIGYEIEQLHDKLARTGDDIWIAPVEVDGEQKIAIVRGDGVGKHVFEFGGEIEIVDSAQEVNSDEQ